MSAPEGVLSANELAILAHEIRGALTVIGGYAELLQRPLSAQDRERALAGIGRATRRIDALLGSTSEMTAAAEFERLDLGAIAERVVSDQAALSGRAIRLEAPQPVFARGVEDAVERALGNLVDNALKYSTLNSEVLVQVASDGEKAVIRVLDRGPGIPEADAEKVFEPFERIGDAVQGTGLGLTVVRSVAESHGGTAEVQDRPGGGSIFTLSLPMGEAG